MLGHWMPCVDSSRIMKSTQNAFWMAEAELAKGRRQAGYINDYDAGKLPYTLPLPDEVHGIRIVIGSEMLIY